jgi:hypothetical protein
MKNIFYLLFISLFTNCNEEGDYNPYPCKDGMCNSVFYIDSPNTSLGEDGYWHVKYYGPKYFTIAGKLDELNDEYIINNIPLVVVAYDSDYWVTFDDLSFIIPLYSPFGLHTQTGVSIPVGNLTYNIGDIAQLMEPLNIAGYQITKNTCFDCPYSPRLFATYSKYTYRPKQQFYLDKKMVGDTLSAFIKVKFNTDLGESVEQNHELKIIIEE